MCKQSNISVVQSLMLRLTRRCVCSILNNHCVIKSYIIDFTKNAKHKYFNVKHLKSIWIKISIVIHVIIMTTSWLHVYTSIAQVLFIVTPAQSFSFTSDLEKSSKNVSNSSVLYLQKIQRQSESIFNQEIRKYARIGDDLSLSCGSNTNSSNLPRWYKVKWIYFDLGVLELNFIWACKNFKCFQSDLFLILRFRRKRQDFHFRRRPRLNFTMKRLDSIRISLITSLLQIQESL